MTARPLSDLKHQETATPVLARPLPPQYFWDPGLYEQEKTRVFAKSWRYVGHQSEFAEPGDYTTMNVAGESIFVLRGSDGNLRAFYNVCQHRATELLTGKGKSKARW